MANAPLRFGNTELHSMYDLLDLIRIQPGMWLGNSTVDRLFVFLQGFATGLEAAQRWISTGAPPFRDFHVWLAERLGRKLNGHNWPTLLLEATGGDEAAAFERFWDELDTYRAN